MNHSKSVIMACLIVFLVCGTGREARGQDEGIDSKIMTLAEKNAKLWIHPAISAFSANLNSGLFNTAEVHDLLGFDIGLVGMLAPIPNNNLLFLAELPDQIEYTIPNTSNVVPLQAGIDYDKTKQTATVLGKKGSDPLVTKRQIPTPYGTIPAGTTIFEFPGGIDFKAFPLVALQLSVGLPVGTELKLRYIPSVRLSEEIGNLKLVGFGLRHSLSQWLLWPSLSGSPEPREIPLNLSAHLMYQKFTLEDSTGGDFIGTKVFSVGVQASKKFFIFTFYGGIAYEKAKTHIYYTYRPESGNPTSVRLENLKGDNNFRVTGGLKLHLLLLDLFADYSLASQPSASLGLALSMR